MIFASTKMLLWLAQSILEIIGSSPVSKNKKIWRIKQTHKTMNTDGLSKEEIEARV